MGGLKEIKGRIKSVGSTIQITSAMKMVSAAKLKSAQDNIVKMRPYATKLQELLQSVCNSIDEDTGVEYLKSNPEGSTLFVVLTSNKGLCGSFNSNVIKSIKNRIDVASASGKTLELLTIGKKAF